MGRLLRKRSPFFKKKKSAAEEGREAEAGGGEAAGRGATAAAASEARKSPLAAAQKIFSLPQPALDRMAGGRFGQAIQFLKEVKLELKKVVWPSRKQTVGSTAVVIVLVIILSLFMGVVDISLSTLISSILQ
jgi:preprotein translocase subunit SecE